MGRTSHDDSFRIDTGCILGNLLNQAVRKNVLRDGDRNSTAEGVEKYGDSISNGHVFLSQHDLDSNERDLNTCPGPGPSKNLISDPSAC